MSIRLLEVKWVYYQWDKRYLIFDLYTWFYALFICEDIDVVKDDHEDR